jgi:hypothetical protein
MLGLAVLVGEALFDGDGSLEREIFGTEDPKEIAAQIEVVLGSRFDTSTEALFYRHSVGVVIGVRLGHQDIVLKFHRWHASLERLVAIQRVQGELHALGIPAPRPLFEPTEFGSGVLTMEELLPGDVADGHDARIRRVLAQELFRLIVAGRSVEDTSGLDGPALLFESPLTLWPTPHSPRFDFVASQGGAEWIDELAWSARRRLVDLSRTPDIGHLDWRVSNLGFVGTKLTAIYDWDSIGLATETFTVGSAAATFSTDWSKASGSVPSLQAMKAFVADYEHARGRAFDASELDEVDAANLLLVAYGARCQHSDVLLPHDPSFIANESWIELLRERGERGLLD